MTKGIKLSTLYMSVNVLSKNVDRETFYGNSYSLCYKMYHEMTNKCSLFMFLYNKQFLTLSVCLVDISSMPFQHYLESMT